MILCPLTSDIADAAPLRVLVEPSPANGLRRPSHAMIDKLSALSKERCREVIGSLDPETMARVDQALLLVFGLAD